MIFKSYIPKFPLNQFIQDFFYFEGFNPEHRIDRFLPDGNAEMVISLAQEPQFIYDNHTLKEIQACHHMWVSGIRTEPISIPSGKESKMIVVNFKKGCSYPFYPFPLNEITDWVVDADLIFGEDIEKLRSMLLGSNTIEDKFAILEQFLFKAGKGKLEMNVKSKCVNYAVTKIQQYPSSIQIRELAQKIGFSQKHFIRIFKDQVGLTPKSFMKIIRFQNAIQEIDKLQYPNWSKLSFECGYYDQAHFINEFKSFSGFSPTDYVHKKNDQLNYIPVA